MKRKYRVLRTLLWGLLALEAVYIGGTAWILNNGFLLAQVNTNTDSLRVEYDLGYSLFPGRVRLEGLKFRLQDHNIQFHFEMSRVSVSIDLVSLLSRKFHTTAVRGENLAFHFRFKKSAKTLLTTDKSVIPVIPGLASFLKTPDPHPGPPENPWKIRLEGVDIRQVSDVWFDEFRFKGSARVQGGFYLNPGRELQVDTSHITVEKGGITVGSVPALENFAGALQASVGLFHPDEIPDIEILNRATANIKFQADLKTIAFMNYYVRELPWLRFEEGAGRFSLDARIDQGRFLDDSHLTIHSRPLALRFWNQKGRGEGRIEWRTSAQGSDLQVALDRYSVFREGYPGYTLRGDHLLLTASSDTRDFVDSLRRLDVQVAIPDAEVADLRYGNSYLPKRSRLRFMQGTGKLSAEIKTYARRKRADTGWLKLSAHNARVEYGKLRMQGNLLVDAKIAKSDITGGEIWSPLAEIEMRNVLSSNAGDKSPTPRWWADIRLNNSTLSVGDSPAVTTHLNISSLDGFPFVAVLSQATQSSIPSWVQSILKFPHLQLSLDAAVGEDKLKIENFHAVGDNTRLVGWLENEGDSPEGHLLLEYGPLAAGLAFEKQGTRLRLEDAVTWYRRAEEKRNRRAQNTLVKGDTP